MEIDLARLQDSVMRNFAQSTILVSRDIPCNRRDVVCRYWETELARARMSRAYALAEILIMSMDPAGDLLLVSWSMKDSGSDNPTHHCSLTFDRKGFKLKSIRPYAVCVDGRDDGSIASEIATFSGEVSEGNFFPILSDIIARAVGQEVARQNVKHDRLRDASEEARRAASLMQA